MKFLNEEWFEEFKNLALDTFSEGKTPSNVNLTLCECYSGVPQAGGEKLWILYVFENGVITKMELGKGESTVPKADYISDADYETVVKNLTGKLSSAKGVLSGKIKLKGNVTKALKLLDTHAVLTKCKFLNDRVEF